MLYKIITVITLMMIGIGTHAEEAKDDVLTVEAQVSYQASRNKAVQRSLTSALVYVEKPLSADWAVFGNVYADQEFKSAGVGVAKKFGDFQVAFGLGKAYYDNKSFTMPHGFVYWANGDDEALLYAEKYLKETVDPVFVKGYYMRKFGSWIAGVYGETDMGIGPMVGYKLTDTLKVTFAVPVVHRGDMKFKLALVANF